MRNFLTVLLACLSTSHATLTYVPPDLDPRTANILVVLHGCLQTPESMALGTGFNLGARTSNFVVVYPRVPEGSQPLDCWSWYKPENQTPESGQLRLIMDQVQETKARLNLAAPKVFAAGLSAGASMVSGLLACYPHDFAGGIVHSGTGYAMASDEAGGLALMKDNSSKRYSTKAGAPCDPAAFAGRLLVVQGTFDRTVRRANATRVLEQFFPNSALGKSSNHLSQGLPYCERELVKNEVRRAKLVEVRGLTHSWSGSGHNRRKGDEGAKVPFFSRFGPSATDLAWSFINDTLAARP